MRIRTIPFTIDPEREPQYKAALLEERELWELVKGKHAGTASHDAEKWSAWLASAERMRAISSLLEAQARVRGAGPRARGRGA